MAAALRQRPSLAWAPTTRYGMALAGGAWFLQPEPGDRRFRHPSWTSDPRFFGLRQLYLAWSRYVFELVDAAGLDPATTGKARFALEVVVDALAPTNYFWSNPAALERAV
ncbi:MAG TPA: hypothetical protein VF244_02865, partial [Acidimicrobiales bacterium]